MTSTKSFPYLLRDVPVVRPGQVWASDITYIRMRRGFVYLVAVMDWFSRYVLSWSVRSPWTCTSALRLSRKRWQSAGLRSSIPIRALSSPAVNSQACSLAPASGSAWTAKAEPSTTSSSTVAHRQVRGSLSQGISGCALLHAGAAGLLPVLQRAQAPSGIGQQDSPQVYLGRD